MKTLVMLPTYNEKDNLKDIVNEILKQNKKLGIIIVDDNSPDGTGIVADQLKEKNKEKIFVIHRKQRGRATAGITGFKAAIEKKSDYIIEMDADFSHDPKNIPIFLELIKKYDVVIGSRYVKGGGVEGRTIFRDGLSFIVNTYNRVLLGLKIKDIAGGFKCYRRKVLESINLDSFYSTDYTIGAELLYRINKKGFSMIEVPIIFKERRAGKSKMGFKQIIDYVYKVLKIRLNSKF